jgi:hypothetical protein
VRKTTKVVNLAAALGALAAPAAAPAVANATRSDKAHNATNSDKAHIAKASETNAEIWLPRSEDLMSFTVHQNSDGLMVPQHESHASHASHESHASHASSSY